jgi:hypothetical protein
MHDLPFQTITQFAALGLTLIAGWFFGLASSGAGRKWRARYQELDVDHAGYRDRAERDLKDRNRRVRELEAENARLLEEHTRLAAAPVVPVAAAAPVVAAAPVATHVPASSEPVVTDHVAPPPPSEPVVVEEKHGQSTAALAGAAVAGAAAGAVMAHAAHEAHDEKPHDSAEPGPADYTHADPSPEAAEPQAETHVAQEGHGHDAAPPVPARDHP